MGCTVYLGLLLWGSLGAVQSGSHLCSVSSVGSVCWRLAGWIRWQCQIPDINHQPPLLLPPLSAVSPFSSPSSPLLFLLHPASAVEPVNTTHPFLLQFTLSFPLGLRMYLLPSPCSPLSIPSVSQTLMYNIQGNNSQADSTGFVMNGILLHIRRKCTLQCGFTNCFHCPQNDSLYTAENGSQPDSQTDSTAQTDRLVCRQTAEERQAEGLIVCDRYRQNRTDNPPNQKRPATCRHTHTMKDRRVTYCTQTGSRERVTSVFSRNMIFYFEK